MTSSVLAAPECRRQPGSPSDFDTFSALIQKRFTELSATHGSLFTTDAPTLNIVYLHNFSAPEQRQIHNCHCCRRFIESYGNLVFIDQTSGKLVPALWHDDVSGIPAIYRESVLALHRAVKTAKVTGVFLSSDKIWGTPLTGEWTHFAVTPRDSLRMKSGGRQDPSQVMAEKREDFRIVNTALQEFPLATVNTAVGLLESGTGFRSEKVAGPAKWFKTLHENIEAANSRNTKLRSNIVWLAVATAPPGFCHIRSSMIGTLLEDIQSGMDFADVSKRFAAKMNPLRYQRPVAPPSAGNIKVAEKIFSELGLAPALNRRFARLDELRKLWSPKDESGMPRRGGGIFGHLTPKSAVKKPDLLKVPTQTLTWEKFSKTVLPNAVSLEFYTPAGRSSFAALVTAADPEAPPILQWDLPDDRNPVSWYLYGHGSRAADWDLRPNTWVKVNAVVLQPSLWNPDTSELFNHQGKSVFLILEGAKDTNNNSLALFPEILKGELREVRSVIEAHSRSRKLEGLGQSDANGIKLQSGQVFNARVRVTTETSISEYLIDRWD